MTLTGTSPSRENDFPENKRLHVRSQILLHSPNVKRAFSNLSRLSSAATCLARGPMEGQKGDSRAGDSTRGADEGVEGGALPAQVSPHLSPQPPAPYSHLAHCHIEPGAGPPSDTHHCPSSSTCLLTRCDPHCGLCS